MTELRQKNKFQIGERWIGAGHPTYIIAEIGNNHNGSLERAIHLVDLAIEAGANCAKFQMRDLAAVYRKKTLSKGDGDLSTEYTIDLLKRFELKEEEHFKIVQYCNSRNITYLCTPWDTRSIGILEKFGVQAYKVASADLPNLPLIESLIATGKPLILSTGMSKESEIQFTLDFLNLRQSVFALLHCNSTYPAPFHSINLNYIHRLRELHPIIGYSGHERGTAVSIAAVALGAKVLERHFTLDRQMEGPDHAASLEAREFAAMVEGIRQVEESIQGDGKSKSISQGEMMNRENLGKSLIAAKRIPKGTLLKRDDVEIKSPGLGLSPQYLDRLIGVTLDRDVEEEDFFYPSDLGKASQAARQYTFSRPWGLPVRYHDFGIFSSLVQPDLWEFHLSYSDMDLDPSKFISGPMECGFVVHAPELFSGGHLMDLATFDDDYRNFSIKQTQRVVNLTRALQKYFPNESRPLIVANIGGISLDAPFPAEKRRRHYERFIKSLGEIDLGGVELIPQTMAPFPWHFGGQRYQNLFVDGAECASICKEFELRMCLDVSHSKLTSNYLKRDFNEFLKTVAPFAAHLHLGDAKGVDGEGLQVDEGEIDFKSMASILREQCPKASFIPEIWQGHKNGGEGFWNALELLEVKYRL